MLNAVNEINYRGIVLRHFPSLGWEFAIDGKEFRFPTSMDAQKTIDDIYQFIDFFATKHEGTKLTKYNKT